MNMDPVTLMSIAASLATFFSFGGDVFDRLAGSLPADMYSREEIEVWRHVVSSIHSAESNLLYEIKGVEHRRLIADLASERLKFNSLVNSLRGADLAAKIDEFLVQLESKNFEFNFVTLLNSSFHGQKSFLQVIVEKLMANDTDRHVQDPPQKVLFEFYLSLAENIGEANTLHRFALAQKSAIQGTLDNTDFKYIDNTLTTAIELLKSVIGSAFGSFKTMDNRIYIPRITDNFFMKKSMLFNLDPVRVREGHVVTGARFIQENNVVHLQLQSAKLMPLGLIDQSTIGWEELQASDHTVLADVALTSLAGTFVDHDIALTGVQLFINMAEGMESGTLRLLIIGRRFDFGTGQLGLDEISKNLTENLTDQSMVRVALSQTSFSTEAPLASINIMEIKGTGFTQYAPTGVTLDYKRLLELNVDPELHQQSHFTSGSFASGKMHVITFLSLILHISQNLRRP